MTIRGKGALGIASWREDVWDVLGLPWTQGLCLASHVSGGPRRISAGYVTERIQDVETEEVGYQILKVQVHVQNDT